MKYKIIGITGPARSGKDTTADCIISKMSLYIKIHFAEPIKQMLKIGLCLTDNQLYGDKKNVVDKRYNRTPRYLMQKLGTEFGRDLVSSDIWVNATRTHMLNIGGVFVIPDVRFESEAKMIRDEGGIIIHISGRNVEKSNHESEKGIIINNNDIIINNLGTIHEFEILVNEIISDVL